MSADATIFLDGDSGWTDWKGSHDAPDNESCWLHLQGGTLSQVLNAVETCMGAELEWAIRTYPDGTHGLVGYRA